MGDFALCNSDDCVGAKLYVVASEVQISRMDSSDGLAILAFVRSGVR